MSGVLSDKQREMKERMAIKERPKVLDNKRTCPRCGNPSAFRRRYCIECINRAEERLDEIEMRRLDGDDSVIYFIQAENSPIKIGYTRQLYLQRRVAELQTGNPYVLRLIGVIDGGTLEQESALHNQFKTDRMCGEWFMPSEELLAYIRKHSTRKFYQRTV